VSLAGYIVLYAVLIGCAATCAIKGKFWFVGFGLVLPIFWIVGAVRPGKPGSAWDSRFNEDFSMPDAPGSDPT
jgi:hypothetical protein